MQKILDDNYYAMPVHAPENENGVYQVKDQANEKRTVLKELNGTLYRVEFSERVKAALDSNDTIGVYIMTDRDLEMPLCVRHGYGSTSTFSLYQVVTAEKKIDYVRMHVDDLCCFCSYERVEYSGQ